MFVVRLKVVGFHDRLAYCTPLADHVNTMQHKKLQSYVAKLWEIMQTQSFSLVFSVACMQQILLKGNLYTQTNKQTHETISENDR